MWSFFKIVEIPPPRNVSFLTTFRKESELIDRIAFHTSSRRVGFVFRKAFYGAADDIKFEVVCLNSKNSKFAVQVIISGVAFDEATQNLELELKLHPLQSMLLRFMSRFLIFWWVLWTLSTLIVYPILLFDSELNFFSLVMFPFGVIFAPFIWRQLKKVPSNSLDSAQETISKILQN